MRLSPYQRLTIYRADLVGAAGSEHRKDAGDRVTAKSLSEKPYRRHPYAAYTGAQGCIGYVFRI